MQDVWLKLCGKFQKQMPNRKTFATPIPFLWAHSLRNRPNTLVWRMRGGIPVTRLNVLEQMAVCACVLVGGELNCKLFWWRADLLCLILIKKFIGC